MTNTLHVYESKDGFNGKPDSRWEFTRAVACLDPSAHVLADEIGSLDVARGHLDQEVHSASPDAFLAHAAYRKVTIKGVTGISMSPATSGPELFRLAAFIPEGKGSPASAGVYDWSAGASGGGHSEPQPLVKKSFFRTQGEISW